MTTPEQSGILVRRLAYYILATLAAVATGLITPSTDLLSLFLLWVPIATSRGGSLRASFFPLPPQPPHEMKKR